MLPHGNSIIHGGRQIEAIKGNGTNGDYLLYHGDHLSYSIANFFNQAHDVGGGTVVNFTQLHRYDTVKDFNDKVYIDATTYEFYNVGDEIKTPEAVSKNGYTFGGYQVGEETVPANTIYIVDEDTTIKPIFNVINYTVEFYDGEQKLTNLETTYNIESGLSLEDATKEGYIFDGWYEDENLTVGPITFVSAGNTGDLKFYAKFNEGYVVTYDLGKHGHVSPKSKEQLFDDLIADWKVAFGRVTLTRENFYLESYFDPTKYQFNFFTSEPNASKYAWLKNYLIDVAEDLDYYKKDDLINNVPGVWRINIHAFFNENVYEHEVISLTSIDFTDNEELNIGFWEYTGFTKVEQNAIPGGSLYDSNLINVCCLDHQFAGWYDNPDFNGNALSKLPEEINGNITLYAKWDSNILVIYDYGKHGYVNAKTKEQVFEEFAGDYITFNNLSSSANVLGNFNGVSYGKQTLGFFNDSVYGKKWGWFKQYFIDLKSQTSYKGDLNNEVVLRSNIHHFFLETKEEEMPKDWLMPMNFYLPEIANGFWKYEPTSENNKVEEFDNTLELLDGTTLLSVGNQYIFVGWYDNPLFEGNPVTELPENLETSLTLYAKWQEKVIITYDLGEYGYINDKTQQELLEEFAADYIEVLGRKTTVEDLLDDFFVKSALPTESTPNVTEAEIQAYGDITKIFRHDNNKWAWLQQYILNLAEETSYDKKQSLIDGDQTAWRSNIHALINKQQFMFNDLAYTESMDFSSEEMNNGFWQDLTTYQLVYEINDVESMIDISIIKSWSSNYEAVGFVDKDGVDIISLDDINESTVIYVKWQEK